MLVTAQNNNEMTMCCVVRQVSKRVLFGIRHYEMLQLFTLDRAPWTQHST